MIDLLRWLHVIGAAVLFGTGAGIAFFMLRAHLTRNPVLIAHVAETVVVADFLFTASAVVVQPITGYLLAEAIGWPISTPWIVVSLCLYVVAGVFWLPVVFIQMKLRDLARAAAEAGAPLPPEYDRQFRIWFLSGFPAFGAVAIILWLMLAKPALM